MMIMSNGLSLAVQQPFGGHGGVVCDFWKDNNDNELWMTREQIGIALEYKNPVEHVRKIHQRHKERLDKFSGSVKLSHPLGGIQDTVIYSSKGVYEVCRWSRSEKADAFVDFVWGVIDGLRIGELVVTDNHGNRHIQK